MGTCLAHRGPDDEGYYEEGPLGLAHKRLTILDTSRRGRQPMFTEDGQLAITFNGEVYNFLELRADLEASGHAFQTQTDTEVILRLYQVEGEGMLSRLNGMFAFAIWDRRRSALFIARDRLGHQAALLHAEPGRHRLRLRDQGPVRRRAGAAEVDAADARRLHERGLRADRAHALPGHREAAARLVHDGRPGRARRASTGTSSPRPRR